MSRGWEPKENTYGELTKGEHNSPKSAPHPSTSPKKRGTLPVVTQTRSLVSLGLGLTIQIVLSLVDSFQNTSAVSCPWLPDRRGGFLGLI